MTARYILVVILLGLGLWVTLERGIYPHRSTRAFWNLSDLPLAKKLEGYLYASRPAWYLKPATWLWFMQGFAAPESAAAYHGKIITRTDAGKLINVNMPIVLTNLEHVIPYPLARSIILQDPLPSLAVTNCPCRAQKKEACQPQDVCLVVGEPYTSFVVDHQPGKARRITVAEALEIIQSEEMRGHIHTAWFKDVMHDRFYTICNCCTCCCLGMKSYVRGIPRLAHSGYSPSIDYDACSACGGCASICPFQAMTIDIEGPETNFDLCMGCGLCVSHCPAEAIQLIPAPHRGIPLDIVKLAP